MSRTKYPYRWYELHKAVFRYGFMEYTGERPRLSHRKLDPYTFTINGVPVKFVESNYKNTWQVTCPQCQRPVRTIYKYPKPDAPWGCKRCVPHSQPHTEGTKTVDEVFGKPVSEDAIKDLLSVVHRPEKSIKTDYRFARTHPLAFITSDDKIPLREQRARFTEDGYIRIATDRAVRFKLQIKLPTYLRRALKKYAFDCGMSQPRCATALIRWALNHIDIVQLRAP